MTTNNNIDLTDPELYLNRDLSILEFNWRVLQQALDNTIPLLERLNYLCISSTNLDEFFEIRVAGLIQQMESNDSYQEADQLSAHEVLKLIKIRAHEIVDEQYQILNNILLPALAEQNIEVLARHQWSAEQTYYLETLFHNDIAPILSPMCLDAAHPFPRLLNKSLNFIVVLAGKDSFGRDHDYAILQAPRSLPRLIALPGDDNTHRYVFLSSIIHAFADVLFQGVTVNDCYQFRVTRNSDLIIDTEETSDLLSAISDELTYRNYGDEVRLEIAHNCPELVVNFLCSHCGMDKDNVYLVNGPVNLSRLQAICDISDRPDLKFKSFQQATPKALIKKNFFDVIKKQDILLHHPYESFTPVIELIKQAANDSNVLAIKQTLYRTGAKSPIVDALIAASLAGKEVTVVVELRARFDEADNVALASRLQKAAVHVVYGVVGYKTHAKMLLILRKEHHGLQQYAHLGTGNYHRNTTRFYTDYGLLTADKAITEDVNNLFLQLLSLGIQPDCQKLLHAPFSLKEGLLTRIENEITEAKAGRPAQIIVKANALVEPTMIQAFYRASMAGVKVDLIIRGICCLKPGIAGLSDNIHVRSVIGRFLEHTRVYYFANANNPEVWTASADLMKRNLSRRVEACFPVQSPLLHQRIIDDLQLYLADNQQAWVLDSHGHYQRVQAENDPPVSAQKQLLSQLATVY